MPPLEKDCRRCLQHWPCIIEIEQGKTPECLRYPRRKHMPERDHQGPWKTAHDAVAEALTITQYDRNDKAGNAEDNFAKIALVWTGLLQEKLSPGQSISAADTARMMIGMKLCRDMHRPHRDNRVDVHGYALCLERVEPTEKA
jgi:hypothetical protein